MNKVKVNKTKAKIISNRFIGNGDFEFEYVSNLENVDEKSLCFYKGKDLEVLANINAGVVIINKSLEDKLIIGYKAKCLILSENPMLDFSKFINLVFKDTFNDEVNIEVDHNNISKFAYVEQNVVFGKQNIVYPNVTIFDGVNIGNFCKIQSGTVVGASGMSYTKDEENYYKLNHIGNTIIKNNVDIGANSTIMKGILESTFIDEGSKIGNHVNVGHNCRIGKRCYISAGVIIGGATSIGDDCWIAPGVSLRDNIKIGNNCTIGVGSVVVKDTEPNSIYYGNPAKFVKFK